VPILLDTNILLRIVDAASAERASCLKAVAELVSARRSPVVCAQVLIEFWVAATRPRGANGLGVTAADATLFINQTLLTVPCLPEPWDIAQRWRSFVSRYGVIGKPAHDTRLVALTVAMGITDILTLNVADFARYAEVRCLTPTDVLSSVP
jgi:predicted nucleic acid-binding protein